MYLCATCNQASKSCPWLESALKCSTFGGTNTRRHNAACCAEFNWRANAFPMRLQSSQASLIILSNHYIPSEQMLTACNNLSFVMCASSFCGLYDAGNQVKCYSNPILALQEDQYLLARFDRWSETHLFYWVLLHFLLSEILGISLLWHGIGDKTLSDRVVTVESSLTL